MTFEACAALVERGDPERFRAGMAVPLEARRMLFALYAFNIEVSRAPWVTQKPIIAEMRLQWWRDALEEIAEGRAVRRHEVVEELAAHGDAAAARGLDRLVAARRWDVYAEAFADRAALEEYLDATSGELMWQAARLLGQADEAVVRDFAFGVGVANLLRAVPALEARGRKPLVDGRPEGVAALAGDGLAALDRARARRREVGADARPALLAGWAARPVLRQAVREPMKVAEGALKVSPLRFARVSLFGWWV